MREVADPVPAPEEVLVRVRATAVNRADVLQRLGRYPAPPGVPADIPGLEFAGEVERTGARVLGLHPGDRVMGLLAGGGYAEKVVVDAGLCMSIPDGLTWTQAAAIPEAFLTAHDALVRAGGLCRTSGSHVLVHAAASGVGTAAVQVASAFGARVVALSRDPGRRARLEDLGVETVLDPAADDAAARIRAATEGGPDIILDLVGANAWDLNASVIRPRGRWVLVGLLSGGRVSVDLSSLLVRRIELIGTVLRSRSIAEKRSVVASFVAGAGPFLRNGILRPIVDRVLPLRDVRNAHRTLELSEHVGKIVLEIADPGA